MKSMADIFGRGIVYQQELQSSEWKSFAGGIRKTRGNACECCRRTGVETHIHHVFYEPGRKAWEYGQDEMVLLCRTCHTEIHQRLKEFRKFVFKHLNPQSFRVLNGALAVGLTQYDPLKFCYAVAEMASSPGSVERFCKAWINTPPKRQSVPPDPPTRNHSGNIYEGPPASQEKAERQFMPDPRSSLPEPNL